MTSTPSSNRLEQWEINTLAAIVEHEYERLRRDTFITNPRAWKRARYANLRTACLTNDETRQQLAEWEERVSGPDDHVGTYAERAEVLGELQAEWSVTPNAHAYRRPSGEDLERLIDRCIRSKAKR